MLPHQPNDTFHLLSVGLVTPPRRTVAAAVSARLLGLLLFLYASHGHGALERVGLPALAPLLGWRQSVSTPHHSLHSLTDGRHRPYHAVLHVQLSQPLSQSVLLVVLLVVRRAENDGERAAFVSHQLSIRCCGAPAGQGAVEWVGGCGRWVRVGVSSVAGAECCERCGGQRVRMVALPYCRLPLLQHCLLVAVTPLSQQRRLPLLFLSFPYDAHCVLQQRPSERLRPSGRTRRG